jgi:glycosyltransferase involved in cell wall biosynthesis
MRVAVITACHVPYPHPYLDKCIQSVKDQTYTDIHHIIVNDGAPPYSIPGIDVINLTKNHNDFGDSLRAMGAASAIGQGYDAIAWLDYDNWYEPNHIELLVNGLISRGASIACSARWLYTVSEEKMGQCYEVDGVNFVDANCYLIGRESFRLAWKWLTIPAHNHYRDDRYIWTEVKRMVAEEGTIAVYSHVPTLCYRTNYTIHYKMFGLTPPLNSKDV